MSANDLQIIWIIIIALSCASAWSAQGVLFKRIKKDYPQKWVKIGEPGWKTATSLDSSKFRKAFLTLNYILKGDSVLDGDANILKLKNITKFVYFLILIAIVLFLSAVVVFRPDLI